MNLHETIKTSSLETFRQTGDLQFSELLACCSGEDLRKIWAFTADSQLFTPDLPDSLRELISFSCKLPAWADPQMLQLSAAFFRDYLPDIMIMLGMASLPYCYGGADGARVLVTSDRILNDTDHRLRETGTFVWSVCAPEAFSGKKDGFVQCLRVRIIHQHIRNKLLREGWDTQSYGIPANQLDQAGTNLSFSLIVIRAIRRTGKEVSPQMAEAYLHRWNVISALLGLQDALCAPDMRSASILARAIENRQFRPSEDGKRLTDALVKNLEAQPGVDPRLKTVVRNYMAFLVGDKVAEYIGLKSKQAPLFEFGAAFNKLYGKIPWMPEVSMDQAQVASQLRELPMVRS